MPPGAPTACGVTCVPCVHHAGVNCVCACVCVRGAAHMLSLAHTHTHAGDAEQMLCIRMILSGCTSRKLLCISRCCASCTYVRTHLEEAAPHGPAARVEGAADRGARLPRNLALLRMQCACVHINKTTCACVGVYNIIWGLRVCVCSWVSVVRLPRIAQRTTTAAKCRNDHLSTPGETRRQRK